MRNFIQGHRPDHNSLGRHPLTVLRSVCCATLVAAVSLPAFCQQPLGPERTVPLPLRAVAPAQPISGLPPYGIPPSGAPPSIAPGTTTQPAPVPQMSQPAPTAVSKAAAQPTLPPVASLPPRTFQNRGDTVYLNTGKVISDVLVTGENEEYLLADAIFERADIVRMYVKRIPLERVESIDLAPEGSREKLREEWVSRVREAERYRSEQRARGYVRYGRRWIPAEEAARYQREAYLRLQWQEAQRLQAQYYGWQQAWPSQYGYRYEAPPTYWPQQEQPPGQVYYQRYRTTGFSTPGMLPTPSPQQQQPQAPLAGTPVGPGVQSTGMPPFPPQLVSPPAQGQYPGVSTSQQTPAPAQQQNPSSPR
jgi:hypothetical protein